MTVSPFSISFFFYSQRKVRAKTLIFMRKIEAKSEEENKTFVFHKYNKLASLQEPQNLW